MLNNLQITFETEGITDAEFRDNYFLVEVSIDEFKLLPPSFVEILHWICTAEHIIREIHTFKVLSSVKNRNLTSEVIVSNVHIFKLAQVPPECRDGPTNPITLNLYELKIL